MAVSEAFALEIAAENTAASADYIVVVVADMAVAAADKVEDMVAVVTVVEVVSVVALAGPVARNMAVFVADILAEAALSDQNTAVAAVADILEAASVALELAAVLVAADATAEDKALAEASAADIPAVAVVAVVPVADNLAPVLEIFSVLVDPTHHHTSYCSL